MSRAIHKMRGALPSVVGAYLGKTVDEVNRQVYTFSGVDLGTEADARILVAIVTARLNGSGTTTSDKTIDGNAATDYVENITGSGAGHNAVTAFFYEVAAGETGATGDISITYSNTMSNASLQLYEITKYQSTTAEDTDSNTTTSGTLSMSLAVTSGAFVICVAHNDTTFGNFTFTFTGSTEDNDSVTENDRVGCASAPIVDTDATFSVAVTGGAGPDFGGVALSIR